MSPIKPSAPRLSPLSPLFFFFSAVEEFGEELNGKDQQTCCEQRSITETVINGSMKETVSLTVDAKTETAVFKRFVENN